jgi:tetratricopeptide (TPR) repeat protein
MDSQEAQDLFKGADTLFLQGDYAGSLMRLEKLDALYPKEQNIMYPRAICLMNLTRMDEALTLCDEMIELFQLTKARNLKAQIIGGLGGGAVEVSLEDPVVFGDPAIGTAEFGPAVGDAGAQPWARIVVVSAIVFTSLAATFYWLFLGEPG